MLYREAADQSAPVDAKFLTALPKNDWFKSLVSGLTIILEKNLALRVRAFECFYIG